MLYARFFQPSESLSVRLHKRTFSIIVLLLFLIRMVLKISFEKSLYENSSKVHFVFSNKLYEMDLNVSIITIRN